MSGKRKESRYYRVFDDALALSESIEQMGRKRFDELTGRQVIFLAMICSFDAHPSLGDMARKARCSHQNAKTVLAALHEKGFLEFQPDTRDQRILRVHLTDKGSSVGQRALGELEKLVEDIGEKVGPADIEAFTGVIAEFSAAFRGSFSLLGDPSADQEEKQATGA
ncbi:MarR family winged helix-turn-helix transcriptional regulator [Raoultibacter phocaeensis]|uniref:MarR family winged helix-turn-helix transcriptional regulator n=1 Tax=Raoultibacter phocaeensis TaxID=2479841 RepID=UPI001119495F|nr:winged helix DNA-binding protein [Raoultibacter phocaeensis]